jgi:hypothetical protein
MNIHTNAAVNNNNAIFAESLLEEEEINNLLAEIESATRIATLTEIVKSAQELGLFNSAIRDAIKSKKAEISTTATAKEIDPRRYGYTEGELYGNGWQEEASDEDAKKFCSVAREQGILSVNNDAGSVFLKDIETYVLSPAAQMRLKAAEATENASDVLPHVDDDFE